MRHPSNQVVIPTALQLAKKIIPLGIEGTLSFSAEVATFVVPFFLLVLKRPVAALLIDMAQLPRLPLQNVPWVLNTALKVQDPLDESKKKFRPKAEVSQILGFVLYYGYVFSGATALWLLSVSYGVLPFLGLEQESTQAAQTFLVASTLGHIANIFERSLQQFNLSTSVGEKSDVNNHYTDITFMKLKWASLPTAVTIASLVPQLLYIIFTDKNSDALNMSIAYTIAKVLATLLFVYIFWRENIFTGMKLAPKKFKASNLELYKDVNVHSWKSVGIGALQILFPVVQAFLMTTKGDHEAGLFGVVSFIFNVNIVLNIGWGNAATSVITENKTAIKKASYVNIALQVGMAALYLTPFFVAPNEMLGVFTQAPEIIKSIKELMPALAAWVILGACTEGYTVALRADETDKSKNDLIKSRLAAQWGVNLLATLIALFAFNGGVKEVIYGNIAAYLLFVMMLNGLFQAAKASVPAAEATVVSVTEAATSGSSLQLAAV